MFKIAAPPYMNTRPLVWGLAREADVDGEYVVPSRIAAMLEAKKIAAGLVSVPACFENPNLQIVPGISISCDGIAESVKLFHNVPLELVQSVAMDVSSLSSVLLARIILKERYGLAPRYIPMPPVVPDMLATCDAAVVIGDAAMCTIRGKYAQTDLGEEWHCLTGLPFVFALWMVNPEMASPELVEMLARSKEFGVASLREISKAESERLGLSEAVCYRYLSETMNYGLTERHMEGLRLFRKKAFQHGFLVGAHEPEMYQPVAEGKSADLSVEALAKREASAKEEVVCE